MRRLVIVIKPFKVDPVVRTLVAAGARCVTLGEARGYGRQKGHLDLYRDESAGITFLPKVRLECVIADEDLERVLADVQTAARTGRIGDGKIFVEDTR